jgi:hypothetical protein
MPKLIFVMQYYSYNKTINENNIFMCEININHTAVSKSDAQNLIFLTAIPLHAQYSYLYPENNNDILSHALYPTTRRTLHPQSW